MYEVKSHKLGKWPFIWRVGHFLFSAKHFLSCFGKLDVRMLEDQNKCKGSRGLKAFPFPEPSVNDQRNEGEGVEEFLIILKMLHEIIKGAVDPKSQQFCGRHLWMDSSADRVLKGI